MIKGIGIDIIDIERMDISNADLVLKILSKIEYNNYFLKFKEKRRQEFLAGRFAIKEAIYKSIGGIGNNFKIPFNELNIEYNQNGQPIIKLNNFQFLLSISHNKKNACAVAI
jgi:holo-[acyl-carrier protein] synthase